MLWLLALSLFACAPLEAVSGFEIAATRDYRVGDLPISLTITPVDGDGEPVPFCGEATLEGARGSGAEAPPATLSFASAPVTLAKIDAASGPITVRAGSATGSFEAEGLRQIPGALSLLPPLLAIVCALLFRQALLALLAGVWIGALFVHDYNPLTGLLRTFDTYLPATLVDSGHAAIVFFTLALGGMVGVITKSGGTQALVDIIARRATSRRSGMLTSWAAGLVVFFDDYANCLLVGNAVRPFTDKLRISREKLAYIVDSTAAPISTVAVVSTWIGFQAGLFEDALPTGGASGYELFLRALPYSFYSFLTIAFVFALSVTTRDFGPMLRAERRAAHEGQVLRPGAQPLMDAALAEMGPEDPSRSHWTLAALPIASVILIVMLGLYLSGAQALGDAYESASVREIIAASDSYAVLLWASFGGGLVAVVLAVARRTVRFTEALEAWMSGTKSMVMALAILALAWALGDMCKNQLFTGAWIISHVEPSAHWLPTITFAISGLIALATGSSFSTMAIVIPIAGPMAWAATGADSGFDPALIESIRFSTLAAVLSGAVFGDHCSPISDTTIIASLAAGCDHIEHVKTQLPYALTAGTLTIVAYLIAGAFLS